jgi:hypothetical protein
MTVHLIPSEFPYIWGKVFFPFYQYNRSGVDEPIGKKEREMETNTSGVDEPTGVRERNGDQ